MSPYRSLAAALLVLFWPAVSAAADAPRLLAGESWSYRTVDGYNGLPQGSWTQTVTTAGPSDIRVELRAEGAEAGEVSSFAAPGQLSAGRLNSRSTGRIEPALDLLPFPLEEGKRWRQKVTRFDQETKDKRTVTLDGRVLGWETVRVPAGEFRALKVERVMYLGDEDYYRGQTRRTEREWYVPELKHWVKLQTFEEYHENARQIAGPYLQGERLVSELTSYKAAGR